MKRCLGCQTKKDYDNLLDTQGGMCAICECTQSDNDKHLAVDHNHETGTVRGLLCSQCNRGIGMLQDNPDTFEAAARYLRESA